MIHDPASRRRQSTRRRLLDTALDLVRTGSLDGLTIHALAAATDYTPGALYRYFPSRDAIVAELEREVIEALHDATRAAPGTGLRRLGAMVRAWQAFAREQPARYALVHHLIGTPQLVLPAELAAPLIPPLLAMVADIGAALSEAGLAGGGAVDRAVLLLATLHGVLQLRKLERLAPDVVNVDRMSTEAVAALLVGFGAPEPAVRAALECP